MTLPQTVEQARHMILNPVGASSPYDWQDPIHLVGYLREDVDASEFPIATDLREIVETVNAGQPVSPVSLNAGEMKALETRVWEMVRPLDGRLSWRGLTDLDLFIRIVLRAKYVLDSDSATPDRSYES